MRNIVIFIFVILLLLSIPAAVYLVRQQQSLQTKAFIPTAPESLIITGQKVKSFTTSSREVSLKVSFFDKNVTPTEVRVANLLEELPTSEPIPFTSPTTNILWVLPPQLTSHTVFAQLLINDKWQTPFTASVILTN